MADEALRSPVAAGREEQVVAAGAEPGAVDLADEYAELGERVGELIERLDANADPSVGEQVTELLVAVDRLHRDALRRLAGLLSHHELLGHALTDPLVAMILDLYDLRPEGAGPAGTDPRVPAAPTPPATPTALSPLIRLQDIRRFPAATMPPASASPAPAVTALEALVAPPAAGPTVALSAATPPKGTSRVSVPRAAVATRRAAPLHTDDSGAVVPEPGAAVWTAVLADVDAPPDAAVASADGEVLICTVGGVLHALRNRCGGTPLPLHFGELVAGRMVCPWHRDCRYDVISGESSSGRRTVVYPIRADGDRIVVALNHGQSAGPLQPSGLRAAPM